MLRKDCQRKRPETHFTTLGKRGHSRRAVAECYCDFASTETAARKAQGEVAQNSRDRGKIRAANA